MEENKLCFGWKIEVKFAEDCFDKCRDLDGRKNFGILEKIIGAG